MKHFLEHSLFLLFLSAIILSCGGAKEKFPPVEGDVVPMRHSSLLKIVECDGYTVVDVTDPWGGGIMQRYLLVPSNAELPTNMPAGVLLRTPLESVVLSSGIHAGLLCELGVVDAVKGVCDARYFYNDAVADGLATGVVADCGSSSSMNRESIVKVSPSAVFVSPYENSKLDNLEELGYPLIMCADYMESSPLGRAEWMRFYGRLFGKAVLCDSLFASVCNEYETLCGAVKNVVYRPRLMCELKTGSVWYMPCGGSTMGRMYADAGANYLFSYNNGSGSAPLSYEVVFDKAYDSDIWLFKYNSEQNKTYSSLLSEYAGYGHFKPFREQVIYACNSYHKRLFEETAFHPEKLLKELIAIFHPHLVPDYTLRYYEKICQ